MSKEMTDVVHHDENKLTNGDLEQLVEDLRKHVLDDEQLRVLRTDDNYFLRFLHASNFDVPAAFKRMQDFHQLMAECPEWYLSCTALAKLQKIGQNSMAVHPGRDKSGRRILIFKIENIDPSKTSPAEQTQIVELCCESIFEETMEFGVCVIVDMKGFSWNFFRWFTPSNIKTGARKLDLYPFKSIALHFVNTSFLIDSAVKILYPFLSEKIKEMLKFHFGDWLSLHEHIEPSILPPECRGTGPDISFERSNEFVFSKVNEIEERFKCFQSICK